MNNGSKEKNKFEIIKTEWIIPSVLIVITGLVSLFCPGINEYLSEMDKETGTFGIMMQIVTTIVCSITSLVGIAFSIQDSDFFGIKIKDLSQIRKKKTDYRKIIIIPIALLIGGLICYCIRAFNFQTLFTIISLYFAIKSIWTEIPLMAKDEKTCLKIVCEGIIETGDENEYVNSKLGTVLSNLIVEKNLKTTYESLIVSIDESKENTTVLTKLLECLRQNAIKTEYIGNLELRNKIIRNTIDCIRDIMRFDFDLIDQMGSEGAVYYVASTLYYLGNTREGWNQIKKFIKQELFFLDITTEESKKDFLISIYLRLLINAITYSKPKWLEAFKQYYSVYDYSLEKESTTTYLFALICFYLYYIVHVETRVPTELKKEIEAQLEDAMIQDNIRTISWYQLFRTFSQNFKIEFEIMSDLFDAYEHSMDYCIEESNAHPVLMERSLFIKWYLSFILISYRRYDYNFKLLNHKEYDKYYLNSIFHDCYVNDNNFTEPDYMKELIEFYKFEPSEINGFIEYEENSHRLFNDLNEIQKDELIKSSDEKVGTDNGKVASEYKSLINNNLINEYGFDKSVEANSDDRYLTLSLELMQDSNHAEQVVADSMTRSILNEIRMNAKRKIIHKKDVDFSAQISSIFDKSYSICTRQSKFSVAHHLADEDVKTRYESWVKQLDVISSGIFVKPTFITNSGFRFNVDIISLDMRFFSKAELDEYSKQFCREDGQYVYKGAFLNREELERILHESIRILTLRLKYGIKSDIQDIVEIDVYS